MLPYDRALRRAERRMRRDMTLRKLWNLDPATVYSGLLAYAMNRGWKPGWAFHTFVEIYSAPPRPIDRAVEPQSNPVTDEWAAIRPRKPRRNPNGARRP
jgi:hypothetical protein